MKARKTIAAICGMVGALALFATPANATPATAGDPSVLISGHTCSEQEADWSGFLFIQTHTVFGVNRGYCFANAGSISAEFGAQRFSSRNNAGVIEYRRSNGTYGSYPFSKWSGGTFASGTTVTKVTIS
jgi:hypothetical protein